MKFFIDTASVRTIKNAFETGVVEGVTTNPSLLSKEPKDHFIKHIKRIVALCKENNQVPLSVEVFAEEPEEMLTQALQIIKELDYSNLNIKIPAGYEELKLVRKLAQRKINVNYTCCFTATQLQTAATAGARYVSLFYNRLLDCGGDPLKVLEQTRKFIDDKDLNCEIIAGSIRTPQNVSDAWGAGAHIVTASGGILAKMMQHPQTTVSVDGFLKDFREWVK
jgi:transaldolase